MLSPFYRPASAHSRLGRTGQQRSVHSGRCSNVTIFRMASTIQSVELPRSLLVPGPANCRVGCPSRTAFAQRVNPSAPAALLGHGDGGSQDLLDAGSIHSLYGRCHYRVPHSRKWTVVRAHESVHAWIACERYLSSAESSGLPLGYKYTPSSAPSSVNPVRTCRPKLDSQTLPTTTTQCSLLSLPSPFCSPPGLRLPCPSAKLVPRPN
ncbi:hypothetical protein CALCODRAFT_93445 [Calocera cornea HHB12733]|uniref:Uncharacterized protein n=1 Tax=Calocera cornea HHB12733 TaxID=1353952 RepID=A0A165D8F5_9BASI|nr:hypothetical protein CALCODRAFT_93445 [Calocera cornea HHB12733]